MEWVETTGQSVELAKEAALDRLGVDRSEAEFEVLEEAQTGWFGRVKAEARVRARVMPTTPRPKQERRDRGNKKGGGNRNNQRNKNRGSSQGGGNNNSGGGSEGSGNSGNGGGGNRGGGKAAAAAGAAVAGGAGVAAAASSSGGDTGSGNSGSGNTGSGDTGSGNTGSGNTGGSESDGQRSGGESGGRNRNNRNNKQSGGKGKNSMHNESDMSVPDQAEVAKTFMEGLLENMGLSGTVGIENVLEDEATVQVSGENVGLLVGPGGRTLNSLQELARTVIQRHAGGSPAGRIRIDVGGYRARRKEALEKFVGTIAAKVVETGNSQALEPMGSADRKIAHDAANEIEGVSTISEGEDPRRRVVIVPAD